MPILLYLIKSEHEISNKKGILIFKNIDKKYIGNGICVRGDLLLKLPPFILDKK